MKTSMLVNIAGSMGSCENRREQMAGRGRPKKRPAPCPLLRGGIRVYSRPYQHFYRMRQTEDGPRGLSRGSEACCYFYSHEVQFLQSLSQTEPTGSANLDYLFSAAQSRIYTQNTGLRRGEKEEEGGKGCNG